MRPPTLFGLFRAIFPAMPSHKKQKTLPEQLGMQHPNEEHITDVLQSIELGRRRGVIRGETVATLFNLALHLLRGDLEGSIPPWLEGLRRMEEQKLFKKGGTLEDWNDLLPNHLM